MEGGHWGKVKSATEPPARAARMTEMPMNATLRRDPMSPKVEISTTASLASLCISTRWVRETGSRELNDYGGHKDPFLVGPAAVEVVDVLVVDDQTVAEQQGGEGSVLWVEQDFGFLVVQPLTDQRKPGFVDGLLGAEQQ